MENSEQPGRLLSDAKAELIGRIKSNGEQLAEVIKVMRKINHFDQRWVEIGDTDLQKGLMALVRAIERPERGKQCQ